MSRHNNIYNHAGGLVGTATEKGEVREYAPSTVTRLMQRPIFASKLWVWILMEMLRY